MNSNLNNEGKKYKMGHTKGRTLMGGGRVSEENKEGEYG
jgi:hypothetical protein